MTETTTTATIKITREILARIAKFEASTRIDFWSFVEDPETQVLDALSVTGLEGEASDGLDIMDDVAYQCFEATRSLAGSDKSGRGDYRAEAAADELFSILTDMLPTGAW